MQTDGVASEPIRGGSRLHVNEARAALLSASLLQFPRLSACLHACIACIVLTVAMVSLLPGQLPGVLHPQPAKQRDPEHAEETLPGLRQSGGLQSHHLQRVSVLIWILCSEVLFFFDDAANLVFVL